MRRITYILSALLLCFGLALVSGVSDADARKAKPAATKAVKKETAKVKKEPVEKSSPQKVSEAKTDPERELWLKRAGEGELLTGVASWFGKDFHQKPTASGLAYDMYTFTAAHRTLPLGTVVKVTDTGNGKSVVVCVTDRGPFVKGRIIDLSYAAAKTLDMAKRGVAKVKLEVVSDETGSPLKADQAFFIKYPVSGGEKQVGPFHSFADAAAMREALGQAHPDARVDVDKTR